MQVQCPPRHKPADAKPQAVYSAAQVRGIVEELYRSGGMKEAQLAGGKKGDSIK